MYAYMHEGALECKYGRDKCRRGTGQSSDSRPRSGSSQPASKERTSDPTGAYSLCQFLCKAMVAKFVAACCAHPHAHAHTPLGLMGLFVSVQRTWGGNRSSSGSVGSVLIAMCPGEYLRIHPSPVTLEMQSKVVPSLTSAPQHHNSLSGKVEEKVASIITVP